MNIPAGLKYTKTHEWAAIADGKAKVGLSDYAQSELGDLVFINLPEPGTAVKAGEAFADVESVKAVSDVYSPVSGTICAINEALLDAPELMNNDPYGAWIIEVEDAQEGELMDAAAYEAFCQKGE